MFRAVPDEEALATVAPAWDTGFRYFDKSSFYRAGLADPLMRSVRALAGLAPRGRHLDRERQGSWASNATRRSGPAMALLATSPTLAPRILARW